MKRFEGKNVLITGGTSGIGRETAKLFAEEGAKVIIIGRSTERGMRIVNTIQERSGNATFYRCDVADPSDIENLKEKIKEKYAPLDILINNAGIFLTQDLDNIDYQDWQRMFRINVDGAMLMTKAFIGDLMHQKGCIVNNASVSGLDIYTSGTKNYMYGASKAALIKFSKLCALNYAPHVRVNVVCPGVINTEIFENKDFSRFDGIIPMGYIAEPEVVGRAIVFLASNDASYITGSVLSVDGGMSLNGGIAFRR